MRNYFGGGESLFSGIERGLERRKENEARNLDLLVKQAQLAESGYDLTQKKGPFGGFFGGNQYQLTQRPDYVSIKDLERQKLQSDIEGLPIEQDLKRAQSEEARRKAEAFASLSKNPPKGKIFNPLTGDLADDPDYMPPIPNMNNQAESNIPVFATPEEAEASGYKGEAIINGKRARIS